MYLLKRTSAFLILTFLWSSSLSAQVKKVVIEDFEGETFNELPLNWYDQRGDSKTQDFSDSERFKYKYRVVEEYGNHFLRYEGTKAMHLNYPLVDKEGININETPILMWDWRIHEIPEGGNEENDKTNDAAASIYVVFDLGKVLFRKVPKSIRYTWSSSLPVGQELSKFFGNQKIIVIGSGKEGLGEWKSFQRNIVDDYTRLFGDPPPSKPLAILILSDGDNTQSYVKADYDNIILKSVSTNH